MRPNELSESIVEILTESGKQRVTESLKNLFTSEAPFMQLLNELPSCQGDWFLEDGVVVFPRQPQSQINENQLIGILREFMPWRKGPFEIFGSRIDSEWRSDFKWQRIAPALTPHLDQARVLDIGCNNGYYFFPMEKVAPSKIRIGIDPVLKYGRHWMFWNHIAPKVYDFLPLGVDDLSVFKPGSFDVILCMGILYHHPSPVGILRNLHDLLDSQGVVILETMGMEHDDSICIVPEKTYAGMKNVYHVPSQKALEAMIRKSGFVHTELIYKGCLSRNEQRATAWSSPESLNEFLDPRDPSLTREGYPRPWRYYYRISKRKLK